MDFHYVKSNYTNYYLSRGILLLHISSKKKKKRTFTFILRNNEKRWKRENAGQWNAIFQIIRSVKICNTRTLGGICLASSLYQRCSPHEKVGAVGNNSRVK